MSNRRFLPNACSFLGVILALTALLFATSKISAQETKHSRPLKCAYFVPSDCQPISDRAERLFRVMKLVQEFYRSEMERNGFGSMTFGLEEEAPGKLKLYEVRAPEPQAEYGRDSYWKVHKIVVDELKNQGVDAEKEVVVVFQLGLRWEGEKAIEVSPFVGIGWQHKGFAWFYDDPMLDSEKLSSKESGGYYYGSCSVGEFNSHYIGGVAHELGHALTLPHDCETSTERATLGNALMGFGNHTFGNETRGEGKGTFLTKSEALRLSVVPAINGKEPEKRPNDVELFSLRPERTSETSLRLSGEIKTEKPVLGLIFYVDRDSKKSDYDAKSWVVEPNKEGTFEVDLTEVAREPSELRVCVVRDCDAVQLAAIKFNPNGSEGDLKPLER